MAYNIIVVGTSAGGIEALKILFSKLKKPLGIPVIVVQHLQPSSASYLAHILADASGLKAYEAEDKMSLIEDVIYTPAPNYHLMMEKDWTLSLNVDERVSYARPSIDVTFESVADASKDKAIGIILTGANHDGAKGLSAIKEQGGYTIVQEPSTAYAKEMPIAAIKEAKPHEILEVEAIASRINSLLESGDSDE